MQIAARALLSSRQKTPRSARTRAFDSSSVTPSPSLCARRENRVSPPPRRIPSSKNGVRGRFLFSLPRQNANWLFLGRSFELELADRNKNTETGRLHSGNKQNVRAHEYRLVGFLPFFQYEKPNNILERESPVLLSYIKFNRRTLFCNLNFTLVCANASLRA